MIALLFSAVTSATAATPSEFYATLLRRGITAYDAQRYTDASKQLRIAAFGLVEAVDQYQVAQAYLTLAYDKLSDPDKAREAARRVVVAERVERRWSTVALPAAVRTAFEAQAAKLLTAGELATLRGTGPVAPPPAPAASTTPPRTVTATPPQTTTATPPRSTQTTTTTPPRTTEVTVPMGQTTTATKPAATVPAPATTQPRGTTSNSSTNTTTATTKPPVPTPAPQTVTATPPRTTTPPVTTQPQRPATQTTTQPQHPATQTTSQPQRPPTQTTPQPQRPATQTATAPPAPRTFSAGEIATRLIAAERALNTANLIDARRVYRELLASANVPHETLIRIAEGLYRARDFAAALQAFTRAGTLRRGEEPYRYYIAVAAYETGDTARAKKELAAALPFIEMTPDVTRYRAKIEGAL